jgi:hypothetical protein
MGYRGTDNGSRFQFNYVLFVITEILLRFSLSLLFSFFLLVDCGCCSTENSVRIFFIWSVMCSPKFVISYQLWSIIKLTRRLDFELVYDTSWTINCCCLVEVVSWILGQCWTVIVVSLIILKFYLLILRDLDEAILNRFSVLAGYSQTSK